MSQWRMATGSTALSRGINCGAPRGISAVRTSFCLDPAGVLDVCDAQAIAFALMLAPTTIDYFRSFCPARLRKRAPGPPPFSSMDSRRFFRRAPRPPPFSSINSTPAFSRALRMAVALATVIAVIPSTDSARWIVARLTPDSRARSAADQRSRARAALI
jgi:hypothetical protein